MEKSLAIASSLLCLGLGACSWWGGSIANAGASEMPATPTPSAQVPAKVPYPMVFARYATAINSPAATIPNTPTGCKQIAIFSPTDLCAPQPRLATDMAAELPAKSKWILPETPKSFFWQQHLKAGQHLVVEVLDADGLPWPSTTTHAREADFHTIKLVPSQELPSLRGLFLVGTVYNVDGSRDQTWLDAFSVTTSANQDTPWSRSTRIIPAAKPKSPSKAKETRKPKKTKKKRRR